MTQEEKELLLLKDLCARLPYGLKFDAGTINPTHTLQTIYTDAETHVVEFMDEIGFSFELNDFKPYLRPMSSMTDEEREEYRKFSYYGAAGVRPYSHNDFVAVPSFEKMDWLHEHHFDYRGLIDKGLALEAPEGMYNTKAE